MRAGWPPIVAAIPYAAVGVGLYALRSAWAAILLYHIGIAIALSICGWRHPLRGAVSGWHAQGALRLGLVKR